MRIPFRISRKRQAKVEVSFKHGSHGETIPNEIIDVLLGQEFEQCIGADKLWEGSTLIKEFDWIAGFSIVYEYFYR